jgi:hypothetical protein
VVLILGSIKITRGSIAEVQILSRSSVGSLENKGKYGRVSSEQIPDSAGSEVAILTSSFADFLFRKTKFLEKQRPNIPVI